MMNQDTRPTLLFSVKLALVAGLFAVGIQTGCSKSEEEAPAAAPEAAAPAQAEQPASAEAAAPAGNVEAQFSKADEAIKKKDYETAVDSMLQTQYSGAIQTEAHRWSYADRMRAMQRYIADGVAAGDPRAIRAQELLRRSASPR